MKILIATFTYPPLADGCAVAAAVLADGLAARGHRVTVATEFHPQRILNCANPDIVQFKISGTANRRNPVRGETEAFQNFLRQSSFDLIIFENWDAWPTFLAEPLLLRLKAKKFLVSHGYTPHIWSFYPKFAWGIGQWIGGWPLLLRTPFLMRQFDQLVFLSRKKDFGRFFDHTIARTTGFKNFSVIPNGAFAQEFNDNSLPDFRKEFGIGDGLMLLCVANYCDRKNQAMAMRAFRRARLENATLVFIGSEFNDYSKQAQQWDAESRKNFPMGRIVWLEKLSRKNVCAAYCAADLFVLAAKAETQPIVLLEAMASRTPWISTNTGCVSELPGGIVAPSENEMTAKMRELAFSPELRQKLSDEGQKASQKNYDWEKVVEAYGQLIKQVCGRK